MNCPLSRNHAPKANVPAPKADELRAIGIQAHYPFMLMQAPSLVSLTYVSSAVRKFDGQELLAILRAARNNNERLGVTGMLLYKDGDFMQTLEGPDEVVASLLHTIAQDPRHRGVIRLLKRNIAERAFGDWSMAFRNLDDLSPEDRVAFSPFLSGSLLDDAFRQQPENCFKLMLSFKSNIR